MAQYEITSEDIPLDFEITMAKDMVERTLRNAKNLLMIRRGEIPYDRNRGLDQRIFHMTLSEANAMIVREMDRVMLWEPDVEVVDAWVEPDEDGLSVIHCIIDVTLDE